MTAKRFTIDVETENYENAYFENDKFLCYEDDYDAILKRLNELAEENQDNKAMIEFLDTENTQITNEIKTRTQIQHQLEKENEQLKQQLKTKHIVNKQYEELQRLKKENKAVKKETQQLKCLIIHMGYTIKNENGTITLELKR